MCCSKRCSSCLGLWVRGLINIFLLLPVGICWHTQEMAQLVQVVINCFFKVFLGLCERQTAAKTYKVEHGVEVTPASRKKRVGSVLCCAGRAAFYLAAALQLQDKNVCWESVLQLEPVLAA